MGNSLRLLILAVMAAFLAGCPGFGDGGPADVQGVWTGTFTEGGISIPVTAAIIDGGNAFLYTGDGALYAVAGLRSERAVSGSMRLMDALPVACAEGAPHCQGPYGFNGTAYSNLLLLSAFFSPGLPELPNLSGPQLFSVALDRAQPYTGEIRENPVLLAPAGTQWQGFYLNTDIALSLKTGSSGTFTGTDAYGCTLTGTIEELGHVVISGQGSGSLQNLFELTLDGTFGFETGKCGTDLVGVGYLSSTGTGPFKGIPGTYFYMGVYNPGVFGEVLQPGFDTGYFIELKVQ